VAGTLQSLAKLLLLDAFSSLTQDDIQLSISIEALVDSASRNIEFVLRAD
jgi:hypothetical protein